MKFVGRFFIKLLVCAIVVIMAGPVLAAENGCDDVENDAIVAELALCSTHAYNIRETKNPTGADKELMRDVIAMKTTLITQQMYKQYEQMESMLRRLKTQLEKAVLTTSLEAKGASSSSGGSSSGSSSFKSDDRNIHMAGVKNCLNYYQDSEILKCYEDNLNMIVNMSGNGDNISSELKKQLVQDFCGLSGQRINSTENCNRERNDFNDYCEVNDAKKPQTLDKRNFQSMIDRMRLCLQHQYRAYNNSQRQQKK